MTMGRGGMGMSGEMMFEPGSVFNMRPVGDLEMSWWWGSVRKEEDMGSSPIWGWATVVLGRNGWVMRTRVEPMIECCDGMQPAFSHLVEKHKVNFSEEGGWNWEVRRVVD